VAQPEASGGVGKSTAQGRHSMRSAIPWATGSRDSGTGEERENEGEEIGFGSVDLKHWKLGRLSTYQKIYGFPNINTGVS
jgi:hypothetical protein